MSSSSRQTFKGKGKGKGKESKKTFDDSTYPSFNFYENEGRLEIQHQNPILAHGMLAKTLQKALLTNKIASLDLSCFLLGGNPQPSEYMEVHDALINVIVDYLKQPDCTLVALNLDGWKIEESSEKSLTSQAESNHYNALLTLLGKALRENESLTSFSFEDSQLSTHNIKTFFAALYNTHIAKLITTERLEKGKSQLERIELTKNIPVEDNTQTSSKLVSRSLISSSSRVQKVDPIADIQKLADKTGITIDWEYSPEPVKTDESSSALKEQPVSANKAKKDDKKELKRVTAPDTASKPKELKPDVAVQKSTDSSNSSRIPTHFEWKKQEGSVIDQEEAIAAIDPNEPKPKFLDYLRQTFIYGVIFLTMGATLATFTSLSLMSALPATFVLFGLTLTASTVGLIALVALTTIGLLVGIGVGLYQAHQDYKMEVAAYRYDELLDNPESSEEELNSDDRKKLTGNSEMHMTLGAANSKEAADNPEDGLEENYELMDDVPENISQAQQEAGEALKEWAIKVGGDKTPLTFTRHPNDIYVPSSATATSTPRPGQRGNSSD